jgi:hypothetical protein
VLAVARYALDLAEASDGGVFVLCTSHRDVRELARGARREGADGRWPLLVHGEEPRDRLLARFRDSGRAVLLGTATFWEGVDVPGDALRALVLAKIPFRVPTEPMTAAHCEAIERRGGDAFTEYMLPHAALRLKQGFGRLIRTAHRSWRHRAGRCAGAHQGLRQGAAARAAAGRALDGALGGGAAGAGAVLPRGGCGPAVVRSP